MTLEDRIRQNLGNLAFQVMHLQTENELLRQMLDEEKKKTAELEAKLNRGDV